jgi:hypothetical protein
VGHIQPHNGVRKNILEGIIKGSIVGAAGLKLFVVSIEDDGGAGPGDHVAVALFSSRRTISRADYSIQLFEFLCFCTAKDAMVVGGLEKLLSTFVRDVTGRGEGDGSGVDVVTSIDRDSGHGNRWPNIISMEVTDQVLMFVGNIDGARRHAVGAGLMPLEQPR